MRTALLIALLALDLAAQPALLPVIKGPVHVAGNRLIDSTGTTVTLRGTAAPADLPLAYAGTMFSTIRQRFNMNSVRLTVRDEDDLPRIAEMVRRANQLELIVILGAEEGMPTERTVSLWKQIAAYFKDYPNVVFEPLTEPEPDWVPGHVDGVRRDADWDFWLNGGMSAEGTRAVGMQALVDGIRSAGATQVILAMVFDDDLLAENFGERWFVRDSNIVYEVCPNNRAHATDAARDRAFGRLSARVPVLAMDWDPDLDQDSPDCHALPSDPKAVSTLIRSLITYFDDHGISWSASSFNAGKLIQSLDVMEPTEMKAPAVCGQHNTELGVGLDVQLHRWGMTRDNFVAVGAGAGSIEIPQGGIAIGYAEITDQPVAATEWPLPTTLGGVRVRIVDAAGVERFAPLFYAGTESVNFLVDAATAVGLAKLELIWTDGRSPMEGSLLVARVAPGFFTATMNARGPVIGEMLGESPSPLSKCDDTGCHALPIKAGVSRVRIFGTGFRQASQVTAAVGGIPVKVVSAGPQPDYPDNDQLVLEFGEEVRGIGERDLIVVADGRLSNVVRIRLE